LLASDTLRQPRLFIEPEELHTVVLILAAASAISLGVADYVAGETLRRDGRNESALTYTAMGSLFGVFVVGAAFLIAPPASFTTRDALWGVAAGAVFGFALPLLMVGMARGPMAIVAPTIGLVSLGVPAIVGPFLGDELTGLELAGLFVALPATALVAMHSGDSTDSFSTSKALLIGATVGALFGTSAILFGRTSIESGIGPAVTGQITATILLLVIGLGTHRLVRPKPEATRPALVVGLLAALAVLTNVLAYQRGPVVVAAAVIGLAPGPTVLLAWLFAHEPINRLQMLGFGLGIVAVVLFAFG
jgi:drug/metabolite transporter (DMT)-like permease